MYGVIFAVLKENKSAVWRHYQTLMVIGVALIASSSAILGRGVTDFHSSIAIAAVFTFIPLGFALIIPAIERLSRPPHLLSNSIKLLSEWSYSIYLCHIPILFGFYFYFDNDHRTVPIKILIKIGAVLSTIAVSAFIFRFLEQPILRIRPKAP